MLQTNQSNLSNDHSGQSHASDAAHKLHSGAIVDEALPHLHHLPILVLLLHQVDREAAPLGAASMEPSIVHMKISGAHCLGAESIKESHLATGSNAHYREYAFINK